jgi:hypothetical protein
VGLKPRQLAVLHARVAPVGGIVKLPPGSGCELAAVGYALCERYFLHDAAILYAGADRLLVPNASLPKAGMNSLVNDIEGSDSRCMSSSESGI